MRHGLAILGALLALGAGCARRDAGAVRLGIANVEAENDMLARYEPLRKYLERKLARPVALRSASDYASVIEALRARQIDFAYFGAAAYARAWLVTNGNVKPLLATLDSEGNAGYNSIVVVKTASAYQSIADLKGKSIAFADPNSTSGYLAPSFFLREQGYDPAKHFGRTGFAGSHENGVIAVHNGTYDAAACWFYSEDRTAPARLELKGLIPKGAVRVVWKSPRLPSSPWTVLKTSSEPLNEAFRQAVKAFPQEDPEGFKVLSAARESGYAETTHETYEPVIRMVRAELEQRKR
jgi:phosphonate transport system substrate-binding protein